MPVKKLLIISNGHGEDSIAAEIVRRLPKSIEVNAYPTLGEGRAYEGVCPIVGPRRSLPSEGHRLRGSLIRDIFAGLGVGPALTFVRKEGKKYDAILVVGDMLGVIMSWFARRKVRIYLDVYKSGYDNAYSKSEIFILRRTVGLVLTRDEVLARQLTGEGVNARFSGNVLMDTVETGLYEPNWHRRHLRAIAVLPGSRATLARNFAIQLDALRRVPGIEGTDVFAVLARPGDVSDLAEASHMRFTPPPQRLGDLGTLTDGRVTVHLSTRSLGAVIAASDVVVGQAGTANLQAIGMGKPVVSFHAEGSTERRKGRNEALAGDARIFTPREPDAMASAISKLLADPEERARRGAIGKERMGPPGAIQAIIDELTK
jgi:uncharacterized protein (TIGR03492 family)